MYAIKRRIYMIGTGWVASAGALIYTAGEKSKPITSPAAGRVRVIRHLLGLSAKAEPDLADMAARSDAHAFVLFDRRHSTI